MRSVSPPPEEKSSRHSFYDISLGFGFESIDLHWKGPVDEVRWLVVDVLHLDDHPLVVSICGGYNQFLDYYFFKWI